MIEEPLQFGEGGRLFGILTLPDERSSGSADSPVFVFLSAGLLHRIGPRRMYVRLARELAQLGIRSLRVDLSGKGDSAPSANLPPHAATARDYEEISQVLNSRLGPVQHIVGGLCSAADDAIRLAPGNEQIVGLLLLDPVCDRDSGFRARQLWHKFTTPYRYVRWIRRKLGTSRYASSRGLDDVDNRALRDFPSPAEMRAAFESIRGRNGHVLSVFTSYASDYYNDTGQLGRVLGVDRYQEYCTEYYWPAAEHTFTLGRHMNMLIASIKSWANGLRGRPSSIEPKSPVIARAHSGSPDRKVAPSSSMGVLPR